MARIPARQIVAELLDKYERHLKAEFLAAVDDLRDNIVLRVIVERLERGDISGAIEALRLDADAFARLERAIFDAYNAGGTAAVNALPRLRDPKGNRLVFRWGTRNVYAENELREHSAGLVTRILVDQRLGIRMAMSEGLSRGDNPRRTALDVVGRVNRVTGKREGGIIGITAAQERYVASARTELSDPATMKGYFSRERRDKRFDAAVRAAIKSGKPLDADTVNRIVGRYSDRLLDLRGEMLARTETMTALGKSRDDAMRQQIDAGKVAAGDVSKVWRSARDERVRRSHKVLNGKAVGIDDYFVSPSGAMLRYPGDPRAPVSEISGCRCWMEYKIDYLGDVVRRLPGHGRLMVARSFAASVEEWVLKVKGATEAIFRESVQELVSQMQALVPVDTGFLRASLMASTTQMPALSLKNPGGSFTPDAAQIELVINAADIGETIYLGYTANYGAYVHYGARGRPPRPWVDIVVQRWQAIVDAKVAELKARLGP